MTKAQKSNSKKLTDPKEMNDFLTSLVMQQNDLGGYESWELKYRQKINAEI